MNHDKIIEKNKDYFDSQWKQYPSLDNMGDQNFINHLLKCTNSSPEDWKNKIVFEGGAGTGRNTLASLNLGISFITATELSEGGVEAITKNTSRFDLSTRIYQADLCNLELEYDNYYDIAFSVNCLPHIPNYKKALSEMVRICKPGGLIMFNVNPQRPKLIAEVDNKIREYTTKMCPKCLKLFSEIMVYWANKLEIKKVLKDKMELSGDVLSAYDHFGLPYTSETTQEQIRKYMEELECEILSINNFIAIKARKK